MASIECTTRPQRQLLTNDVLWYMGRGILVSPKDVLYLAATSKTLLGALEIEIYNTEVCLAKEDSNRFSIHCTCHVGCPRDTGGHPIWYHRRRGGILRAIHQHEYQAGAVGKFIAASLRLWPEYLDAWQVQTPHVTPLSLSLKLGAFDIADMLERAGSDPDCTGILAPMLPLLAFLRGHADLAVRLARRSRCTQGEPHARTIKIWRVRNTWLHRASLKGMLHTVEAAYPSLPLTHLVGPPDFSDWDDAMLADHLCQQIPYPPRFEYQDVDRNGEDWGDEVDRGLVAEMWALMWPCILVECVLCCVVMIPLLCVFVGLSSK